MAFVSMSRVVTVSVLASSSAYSRMTFVVSRGVKAGPMTADAGVGGAWHTAFSADRTWEAADGDYPLVRGCRVPFPLARTAPVGAGSNVTIYACHARECGPT